MLFCQSKTNKFEIKWSEIIASSHTNKKTNKFENKTSNTKKIKLANFKLEKYTKTLSCEEDSTKLQFPPKRREKPKKVYLDALFHLTTTLVDSVESVGEECFGGREWESDLDWYFLLPLLL